MSLCNSNKSQDKYQLDMDNLTLSPSTNYQITVKAYTTAYRDTYDTAATTPFTSMVSTCQQITCIQPTAW